MKPRHWMPFHCGDFLKETTGMSTTAVGAYVYLLVTHWERGSLPQDDATLARIARVRPETWRRLRPSLMRLFDSSWCHKRLSAEALRLDRISNERKAQEATKRARVLALLDAQTATSKPYPYPDKYSNSSSLLPGCAREEALQEEGRKNWATPTLQALLEKGSRH